MQGWSHHVSVTPDSPAANLTDFPFVLSGNLLPAHFWANVKSDLGDVRATTSAGVQIPCYVHRYDYVANKAVIFVKNSPLASGTLPFRIHYGNASATTPAVDDDYGQYECFNSTIRAYYPEGLGDDVTSFLNHQTLIGTPDVGAVDGPIDGSAATLLDGSTQFGRSDISVPTAPPLYFSTMARPANDTASANTMVVQNSGTDVDALAMLFAGATVGDPVQVGATGGGAFVGANTTTGYDANTWYNAAASFIASNSRAIWLNGGSAGTSATNRVPVGLNRITIGGFAGTTVVAQFPGRLAFTQVHTHQRDINWAAYEYAMLSNQATFYAVGTETSNRDYTNPRVNPRTNPRTNPYNNPR